MDKARASPGVIRSGRAGVGVRNYRMADRAGHLDFGIRSQDTALPNDSAHRHEYLQIHVQLEGATRHYLEGVEHPVVPGTLCFVLPFKAHFIPTVRPSRYYIINFSLDFLCPSGQLDLLDLAQVTTERIPELTLFRFQSQMDYVLSGTDLAQVSALCKLMEREDAVRGPGSMMTIRGALLQLMGVVWRCHGQRLGQLASAPPSAQASRQAMWKLMAYLRHTEDRPVTLHEAAHAIHLSPAYLARLVKRETGMTFVALQTARRIARARELLVHTDLTVKEIAFRTGFSDEAYFSRRFRQVEGCTPLACRRRGQLMA